MTDEDADRTYYFSCNKWLGLGVGDGLLERTLVAVDEDPKGGQADYRVRECVGECRGEGVSRYIFEP